MRVKGRREEETLEELKWKACKERSSKERERKRKWQVMIVMVLTG